MKRSGDKQPKSSSTASGISSNGKGVVQVLGPAKFSGLLSEALGRDIKGMVASNNRYATTYKLRVRWLMDERTSVCEDT